MTAETTQTRYVRIPAEIVVEVTDEAAVRAAARAAVDAAEDMPADERAEALERIKDEDIADAVALVVNLEGLLEGVSGLEIVEATWSAEEDDEYEPFDDEDDE
ncbi:hypothetical protein Lfu02_46280 [Longispora fulva]|uniref:Uncharacterized protein n=1 Tax=Longispora fulva TaxID=619741 RepID=A0A8J7GCF9_9ACTN|nr:hypothetical protein [Longispora fulva]MBG6138003.1 hypothetical protein [Longispora fulva]GIG60256.1 hypothetical protein Lfu02_46280 [Longispora fulva]